MTGFAILLGFHLLGVALQKTLHIPLPGNVIGMILFTCSLFLKIIKLEWVEESALFLTKHLGLFFVPLIVGIMVLLPILGRSLLPVTVGLAGSTFVTMAVTGWVTERLSGKRLQNLSEPSGSEEEGEES